MTTTSRPAYAPGTYDYRYEFSETRKVLEEFFKAEQEFPVSPVSSVTSSAGHYGSPSQPSQQLPGQDTGDLAYSLTRIEVCCTGPRLMNVYQFFQKKDQIQTTF